MIVDRTAMLFCPPQPPLRLAAGRPVVIGRHSTCDFSIRSDDISRRHAEVGFEDGHYTVRDLDSTNGTFLNGTRIDTAPTPLSAGDRVELGSNTITFCQVDVGFEGEDQEEAKTIVNFAAPDRDREALRGELSEIPPYALLQVLEMGSKTGVLEVTLDDGPAHIWLRNGCPIHAEASKLAGFDAALEIVGACRGKFRFDPQDVEVDSTIQANVTELLLEACRLEDERSA